jgi:hypothetical protein
VSSETMFDALKAPFPPDAVSWRAQSLYGSKALALAYIDARDVMRRLDDVCGPENWQDSYAETPRGRVICTISIRVGKDWIAKSDGAGDTAVEGEKGGVSDAFKRAAVKWGIGRYLYDTPTVWAPCEVREQNGKNVWKAWAPEALPIFSRALAGIAPEEKKEPAHSGLKSEVRAFVREMNGCGDADELSAFLHSKESLSLLKRVQESMPEWWDGGPSMPKDFVPLHRQIELKEAEMAQQIADLVRAG